MFLFSCAFSLPLHVFSFLFVDRPEYGSQRSQGNHENLWKLNRHREHEMWLFFITFFFNWPSVTKKKYALLVFFIDSECVVFIFYLVRYSYNFDIFLYKYRYLNQKTVILPTQLKLQFKYKKLFNIKIYVVYSFIKCMPSLLVREGSNKESTYKSDIHVPLKFYMIF